MNKTIPIKQFLEKQQDELKKDNEIMNKTCVNKWKYRGS